MCLFSLSRPNRKEYVKEYHYKISTKPRLLQITVYIEKPTETNTFLSNNCAVIEAFKKV